ncbi:class I SAM-dependent DNA methyltransferase [Haliovirga abyssi]|uniref:site-specific DNA-methyltransferase (adenine-specific) n=1 Tax=Haliovirga abyssi TaxID=2996794 RepID=A0AAU9E4W5_9FUSO|nr:N-6 DNA methylase [Haliovirga abyssi]BDU51570.1 type I restriction endonuclease [Haliovirga abyssi]
MGTVEIVQKLWNLCNVLRDDGITYHQYVTELTYILFLKMMKETGQEEIERKNGDIEVKIPEGYRWENITKESGIELMKKYKSILSYLGEHGEGKIKYIYNKANTNIEEPRNLEKIIREIDKLDWYNAKEEGLGNLYEGLLQKNAEEKKSGAGQYFTPRVLIDVMVEITKPEIGDKCNDPAAGTFGFMIAADKFLKEKTSDYLELDEKKQEFQIKEAFSGCELVSDTHRLALMNAMLHDIDGNLLFGDTLSSLGKSMKGYDVVLTNPPFGTKKGGERPRRDDLPFITSNKQLNFLQHIYRSLNTNGKARAAVVLPDNVLFQDGDGMEIRKNLLNKCNLHTILRLPTGIFYAQGVKTNVLFLTRGVNDKDNTKEVWYYDLRTNMPNFGKTNPLKREHFKDFEETFINHKSDKWTKYTIDEIKNKNYNLDLGLQKDENQIDHEDLPNPIESAEEAIVKLEQAADLLQSVIKELRLSGVEL